MKRDLKGLETIVLKSFILNWSCFLKNGKGKFSSTGIVLEAIFIDNF